MRMVQRSSGSIVWPSASTTTGSSGMAAPP
jgi:hypothetical protein